MKKLSFCIVASLFALLVVVNITYGQGTSTLRVLNMPDFPVAPADTAYEGQLYTYSVVVYNGSNTVINSAIQIQLRVDSLENTIATVLQPNIQPGDTVTLTVTAYNFTQPQYKIGNNIVVVWPVVNGFVIPIDTFYADVFFVPLIGINDDPEDANTEKLLVYPNPSGSFIMFNHPDINQAEYVRISSSVGSLVYEKRSDFQRPVDISFLTPGVYFAETSVNGKKFTTRFILK